MTSWAPPASASRSPVAGSPETARPSPPPPRAAASATSKAWWAERGRDSGPASASPTMSTPRHTAATSAAGPAPSANGLARTAKPRSSSSAAWVGREMVRVTLPACPGRGRPTVKRRTGGSVPAVPRVRLDSLLAERGLFPSRTRAAAAVMAGQVRLGPGDARAAKPGQLVEPDVELGVDAPPPYVSRGGIKLRNALDALGLDPAGRRCLDVGASTGGFTDCLLQAGAEHVIALDVAYGELDWSLREHPRVTVIERVNARALEPSQLPYAPDLIVVDVSFISLRKVLPAVLACAAQRFDAPGMGKPHFQAAPATQRRSRALRDPPGPPGAVDAVAASAVELGYEVRGTAESGLPGPAGNVETFVWIAR